LASFETREDFEQFKSHVLHSQLSVSSAIIGLIRQQRGSFSWKDSSPVTFLNWAEGEPAVTKGRLIQECVQMKLGGNYTWQTVTCWQARHFVCSIPVVDASDEPQSKPTDQIFKKVKFLFS
uniref:C-type lectin domain-containing protein n=1 Tax=Gongylonema pulchrum TaxID=637853 RepID=A0A183DFA1_9BILA